MELAKNMTYMWDSGGTNLSWVDGPSEIIENKIRVKSAKTMNGAV